MLHTVISIERVNDPLRLDWFRGWFEQHGTGQEHTRFRVELSRSDWEKLGKGLQHSSPFKVGARIYFLIEVTARQDILIEHYIEGSFWTERYLGHLDDSTRQTLQEAVQQVLATQ